MTVPRIKRLAVLVSLLAMAAAAPRAHAGAGARRPAPPPDDSGASALCMLADSGLIVFEQHARVVRPPASMVKLMQLVLVAEGIERGDWTLEKSVTISAKTAAVGGSRVSLRENEQFTLGHLIEAVAVVSANDAAMAVAEGLWGSEDEYKRRMNERARELGMNDSQFNSVHGLPPEAGQEPDKTTAYDMALLARHCIGIPLVMQWAGQTQVQFRANETARQNTNRLLLDMPGCDGLKTGFTNAAGWCLAVSVVRDNVRMIAVVMGCQTSASRFAFAQKVVEDGFGAVERVRVLAKGDEIPHGIIVQNCKNPHITLSVMEDVWVTLPKADIERVEIVADTPDRLAPPLAAGAVLGEVEVRVADAALGQTQVALSHNLEPAEPRWKLLRSVLGGRLAPAP